MGCSDDALKTLDITKFGDIAALRGFISQKTSWVVIAGVEKSYKKELAGAVRTGKSFKKDSKINKKEYTRVQIGWTTYNEKEAKYVFERKFGGSRVINIKKILKIFLCFFHERKVILAKNITLLIG